MTDPAVSVGYFPKRREPFRRRPAEAESSLIVILAAVFIVVHSGGMRIAVEPPSQSQTRQRPALGGDTMKIRDLVRYDRLK